jgi:hypothetical protein
MRKAFELAFAVGGKLDPSFKNAASDAAKQMKELSEKSKNAAQLTKLAKENSKVFADIGKQASGVKEAWGDVGNAMLAPLKTVAKVGAMVAAGGASIYAFAAKTAQMGDEAVKAAKKAGLTTQEYSKLSYAAEQSGISSESFSNAMKKLNLNTAAAVKGNKEAMIAFERAGVSIYDAGGKLKKTDQILLEASNMFKRMPEGIYKADLAMALFGKTGADLVPLMEQGSDAINKLREDAQRLGIVFDDEAGANAVEFSSNLTEAKNAIKGLSISIGKQLHKPLAEITKQFSDWIAVNREWISQKTSEYVQEFKNHLPQIKEFLITAKDAVVSFAKSVSGAVDALGGWKNAAKIMIGLWAGFNVAKIGIMFGIAAAKTIALGGAIMQALPAIKIMVVLFKGVAIAGSLLAIKIIAIVAAVAAVAYAFYKLEQKFKLFSNIFKSVSEFIGNEVNSIKEAFKDGILNGIGNMFVRLQTLIPRLLGNIAKSILESFGVWDSIKKTFFDTLSEMEIFWGGVWDSAKGILFDNLSKIQAFFGGFWDYVTEGFSSFVNSVKTAVVNRFNFVKDYVTNTFNGIADFFGEKINSIKAMFSEGFINGIAQIFKEFNILGLINDMINKIFGIDLFSIASNWFKGFMDGILNAVSRAAGAVKDAVGSLIPNPVKKAASAVKNAVIPARAEGGIVTRPEVALIGEAGPEAVIPLSRPARAMELLRQITPALRPMKNNIPKIEIPEAASVINNAAPQTETPLERLSKAASNATNSESNATFNFSPSITINGTENPTEIKTAITEAIGKAKADFERWVKEREHNSARVAMA